MSVDSRGIKLPLLRRRSSFSGSDTTAGLEVVAGADDAVIAVEVAVVVVVAVDAGKGAGVTTGAVDAISTENGAEVVVMFVAGTVVDAGAGVVIVADVVVVLTPPRVVVDGALVRSWDLVKG